MFAQMVANRSNELGLQIGRSIENTLKLKNFGSLKSYRVNASVTSERDCPIGQERISLVFIARSGNSVNLLPDRAINAHRIARSGKENNAHRIARSGKEN